MTNFESLILYLTVFAICSMILYQRIQQWGSTRLIKIIIVSLILSVLAGLRNQVGTDFATYDYIFNVIRSDNLVHFFLYGQTRNPWEPGFVILVKILTTIGNNELVFGAINFLPLILILYTLQKYYKDYDLSLCFFTFCCMIYTDSYNICRQFIASSIIFFAFHYVFERKAIKYLLFCIIAMTFHASAIIAIMIYFLWDGKKEKVNYKALSLLGICAIILALFYPIIISIVATKFSFFKKYLYLQTELNYSNRDFYLNTFILLILIIFYNYYQYYDNRLTLFIALYIFVVIIGITGYKTPYFKRLTNYFSMPVILLIGGAPRLLGIENSQIIMKGIIIILDISLFIVTTMIIDGGGVFPYAVR